MVVIILNPYPSIRAANNQSSETSVKKHNKDYRPYQRTCVFVLTTLCAVPVSLDRVCL